MDKPVLYRSVNTKARGVHHRFGGSNAKTRSAQSSLEDSPHRVSMSAKVRRGRDYTPLFKFLLSRVNSEWNGVYSEAITRLDSAAPVFWLVALHEHERKEYIVVSEATYYSGLYVDANGLLQVVNPSLNASSLEPSCSCCTHTFNGIPFTKKYQVLGA